MPGLALVVCARALLLKAWPPINAVRELATKLKARTKHGELNVFLFAELKK